MKIVKLSEEGEPLPKWYGLAYRDFDRDARVFYPIPLNVLVALFMKVRYGFKYGFANFIMEKEEYGDMMYLRGARTANEYASDAYKDAYEKGLNAALGYKMEEDDERQKE